MKLAVILICLISLALAAVAIASEMEDDPKPVTAQIGISLKHCHPGDKAVIHVVPIPKNSHRKEGWFTTTNSVLLLDDLSMIPEGVVRFDIQSVCRGMTSQVRVAYFDLQRPPPPPVVDLVIIDDGPIPPLPPGVVMTNMPLPDASIDFGSYKDLQLMKQYFQKTGRRSQ